MRALQFLSVSCLSLCASCSSPGGMTEEDPPSSAPRPHILLILADDLGYADLGFTGCADFPTPELDRLAAGGVTCTDGHVSASVCAPSRAGLLTGRYQQRSGFECNLGGGEGLLAGTLTFPQQLSTAGYETALVGKWHLGAAEHNHPTALGFEHFTGLLGGSRSYFPEAKPPGKQRRIERDGELIVEESFDYLTDFLTDEGVRLIEERDPERPLFLYMSYTAPHGPMHARPDLAERFKAIEEPRRRTYAAMVAALDEGVGRLRDALEREGMADDTLIVFLSDNGGATGNASDNGPWRGMKGSKWEGGQRVPFVLHWPGQLEPGSYASAVSSLDLASTFLAAGGAEALAVADGVDLTPYLQGRENTPPHPQLYWRRAVAAAARDGDWKLIRVEAEDGSFNDPILVNLATDPGELTNHASKEPARVTELTRQLEAWEQGLLPPRWLTADIWRQNQRKKHAMDLVGRRAERSLP
jgi:arylsulfatase A-like enzyme